MPAITQKTFFITLIALFFLHGPQQVAAAASGAPPITNAFADFSHLDLEKSDVVLDGEWHFYPATLLNPENAALFDKQLKTAHYRPQKVPGSWKNSEIAYGTYHVKLLLPSNMNAYTLKVPEMPSNYNLWINGELKKRKGVVGVSRETSTVARGSEYIEFLASGTVEIVLQTSTFYHREGGIWYPLRLARSSKAMRDFGSTSEVTSYISGVLFVMGLYHIALYLLRRKAIAPLFFGLACFLAMGRELSMSDINFFARTLPWLHSDWVKRIEFWSMGFGGAFLYTFFYHMFEKHFSRKMVYVAWGLGFIFGTIILFSEQKVYGKFLIGIQIDMLLLICLTFYYLIRAFRSHAPNALTALLGFPFIFVAIGNDILHARHVINTFYMYPYGLTGFLFFQAYIIASRFTEAFNTIERNEAVILGLNSELEIKVQERTSEIKALLEYIPQGVLSLGIDGAIEPNYSSQLPTILQQNDIAGRSFKEVFVDLLGLSSDFRDQAWQSISATLGENPLNFEVNRDKLPLQVDYCHQNLSKTLQLTWNVELNSAGDVKRMLVTMLDVTREVQAQKALAQKNKEFDIIRQLIEIGSAKTIQFFSSGSQLIEENERLIKHAELNVDTMKILFVNMHTLKGAARTFQFSDMAAVFHDIESYYASIIKQGEHIDQQRLLDDITRGQEIYYRYQRINKDILGRDDHISKVSIDRDFLEENFKLLSILEADDHISMNLKEVIQHNKDELTSLIFMSLPNVISEIMSQSAKIAKDLQKELPHIALNIDDIFITYRQEVALKNCFIHLLRNALDHGIETAEQRIELRKPPRGTIKVSAKESCDQIAIEVADDGQGLAMEKLRKKGIEAGLLNETATPYEIAELIFHQGLSTAAKLSQVSGRGVGMDAVRRFLHAERGTITVELMEPLSSNGHYYAFKLIITLPSEAHETVKRKTNTAHAANA
jgi:signal transduction histidine kinase